jgi:hypothetical protein
MYDGQELKEGVRFAKGGVCDISTCSGDNRCMPAMLGGTQLQMSHNTVSSEWTKSVLVSGWRENHLLSYCTVLGIRITMPSKMEGFI